MNIFLKNTAHTFLLIALSTFSGSFLHAQAPVVSSFTPSIGPVSATTINITGANFNINTDSNVVYFGAVRASVLSATATSLNVIVPPGALFQPISVLNAGDSLAGYSDVPFAVTYPSAYSITTDDFDPRVDIATTGTSSNPNAVAVGDFDGDGKNDIVITQTDDSSITVLRNVSGFGNIYTSSFITAATMQAHNGNIVVRVADMDGDGKPDIIITNEINSSLAISVYRNTSSGPGNISFAAVVNYTNSNNTTGEEAMVIGDMDNDGKPDVVVCVQLSYPQPPSIVVYKNTSHESNISFTASTPFATTTQNGAYSLALADLDGDGKLDVVGACPLGGTNSSAISIIKNTSSGGNISFVNEANLPSLTGVAYNAAVGDIDGDGKPDIVTCSPFSNIVSAYRNTSSGGNITFSANTDFTPGGAFLDYIAINDFDGDGKNDFIVTDANHDNVLVFRNTAVTGTINAASFANPVGLSGTQAWGTAIGDMDNDGKPDIVTVSSYNIVSIFRNDPPPIITPPDPALCGEGIVVLSITPAASYQWQADTGTGFINLTNAAPYNGVNTDSLSISSTGTGMNGYIYRCMVVNSGIVKYSRNDTLRVHTPPVPVIINNDPFLSTGNYATYQWSLDGSPVTGATNQHYTAAQDGSYTVYVTDSIGCSGTSTVVTVAHVGIANINAAAEIVDIYPNPATDRIIINAPVVVNVSIKDIAGKEMMNVKNASEINIQQLPAGVYFISVFNQYGNLLKTEKLVKTKDD